MSKVEKRKMEIFFRQNDGVEFSYIQIVSKYQLGFLICFFLDEGCDVTKIVDLSCV